MAGMYVLVAIAIAAILALAFIAGIVVLVILLVRSSMKKASAAVPVAPAMEPDECESELGEACAEDESAEKSEE